MTRLWIDDCSNISAGKDNPTAHRNLALDRAQRSAHVWKGGNSRNRTLHRFAFKIAMLKGSTIDADRCATTLQICIGKVRELHGTVNLHSIERPRSSGRL
jgi:hypothetical protein